MDILEENLLNDFDCHLIEMTDEEMESSILLFHQLDLDIGLVPTEVEENDMKRSSKCNI